MSFQKTFKLSAVAIAIAASSSAMAGVSVNGSPSFGTINTTTVSINNLDPGNQVQTTMDDTGLTVDNKISTINPGSAGTPTSTAPIQLPLTGTPNAPVSVTGTVTQSLENQQRTESTQVYDPNKVQFTSSDVIGTEITSITDIEITGQYDANGVLDAGSVSATSMPQALPANPFTPTSTNNQQELTLGRENTSEDYQLSISKTVGTDVKTTTVNAAGISTTGTLNVGGNTTLNAATVNGLLTANNGAAVTGGLTADTATVNGLLLANGGAAVTGGLTADTATVNGALTAGASTLNSLNVTNAATVGGLLSANGGAAVTGGLTADTATVNGTLTADTATVTGALIAGASTLDSLSVTNAATVNGSFTVNNDANVTGNLTAGSVKTSVVDLGTMSSTVTTNTAPSGANRLTARYDTIDGNGSPITIYETQSGGVSTYYTINSGVATEYTDATVIGTLGNTVAPTAGGTTQTQSVLNTTTATVKEVTDKAVTYGEIKTQQDAVTVNGTLNNNENINVNVGTGAPVDVNNQSVVTGIIGTDSNSNNIYGTTAKSKVTAADGTVTADNTTTLTADGIVVADVVSGKSTIVNATGITTDTLIVGGTNVKDTLDAHTTAIAGLDNRVTTEVGRLDGRVDAVDARVTANETAITTLDGRVTTEVNRLDGRIDTVAADTLNSANIYTDGKVAAEKTAREAADTALNTRVDTETAARTAADTALNTRVDTEAATRAAADVVLQDNINAEAATRTAGLAAAATDRQAIRSEFAAADIATLDSAKAYTDTQVVNVNSRVNQLNSRVDDVEKTSYRGIAIALAAQQQIPNIGAGQFAVFGGVGHYEGESAAALGVASVFADGRTSVSAAVGIAGSNEIGGRVGVSYVFGGK